MDNITCMECGAEFQVESDLLLGEIIECPDCGIELEVIQVSPVRVELAPEIEEDWGE